MAFAVATPVFEGPFDLLLHLILKEQVDIYEVSLSRIVDEYLAEIERLQVIDLDIATEFLLIAATLVELKARRLLPGRDDVDLDDELALWEERDLLLARLLECKTFKDVAGVFSRLADDADRSFPRTAGPDERFDDLMPDLLEGTTSKRIHAAYLRAVTPKPVPRIDLFHVAPIRASVADAVAELVDELPRAGRISFRRLTSGLVERLEVIVRFLALLELFKQGVIELDQGEQFGEIDVLWTGRARAGCRRVDRRSTTTKAEMTMSDIDSETVRAIEAIVMVAVEPVAPDLLAQLLEQPTAVIERLCSQLSAAYDEAGHGFQMVKVAGGYRYQSHAELAPYVERFLLDGQRARMSGAALETLAIVAYKQPLSRAQIASIRGVDPDGVLRTLQARGICHRGGP